MAKPRSCKVYGLRIPDGKYVFITWAGEAILKGPKPKEAGTLFVCHNGRLVKAELVKTEEEAYALEGSN